MGRHAGQKNAESQEGKTRLGIGNVPQNTVNKVLAFCDAGLNCLAFRKFYKLSDCNCRQRLLPCPLHLIFQPQLNGSCGRCNEDPRKNPQTVGVDNVQCVLKRPMRSVGIRVTGVEKYYVADDSIAVGVEWEGPSSNHSLPLKEVRCENVQNSGLDWAVSDKWALPRRPGRVLGE